MSATARSTRRARPLLLCALVSILAALASLTFTATIRADGGVPIPAPAGTSWSIVAGYNTGTHAEHDGQDPHAIDIVRTDAPTDWTPVLAPVDGVVSWHDHNCLTIADGNGYAHLLCHIEPDARIQRGLAVAVGEQVGRIFPAGYDANGGIAHLHYAIHGTYGGGTLDRSIPFTGSYAIEGIELHWASDYNLHMGLEFVSSNRPGWSAPSTSGSESEPPEASSDATQAAAQDDAQPAPAAWSIPADAPVGGWRTLSVQRRTSVAGLYSRLQAPISELVVHEARNNTYHRFAPHDPDSAVAAVRTLWPGQAVWALVDPDAAWLPSPPVGTQAVTVQLHAGINLISWQGTPRRISEALANVAQLSHAYRYDPYTNAWQFWSRNGPAYLDTLAELRPGDVLYIVVRAASDWTQQP